MQELTNNIKFRQEKEDNQKIAKSIASITDAETNIMIDVKDIQEAVKNASVADTQVAQASGNDAILEVMQRVVSEMDSLENIASLFVRFDIHPDVSFMELAGGMEILENKLNENATIVFGTACDESLDKEYVRVSMLSFYK